MLRHGQTMTFPERLDITKRAAAGQSDPEIAAVLGCSVWTVRKWRRRGQHYGRTGLSSQMGRPLPSRSRIAARLRAEKLTRRYQKHSDLPIPAIQPEGTPHDEWELDAQGRMHVAGVGNVSLITIIDVASRLEVESYPCLDTTNPPLEAYQLMLRRAFLTTGLPGHITLDHGTVFYDNTMEVDCLGEIAKVRICSGRAQAGMRAARDALTISTEIENTWGQAYSAFNLAMGALEVGDYTEALTVVVRDLGCSEVLSITSPVNKGSIAFHRKMGFEILPGDAEIDGVAVTTNYDGRGSRLVSALFGKTACVRRIFPNSIAESK